MDFWGDTIWAITGPAFPHGFTSSCHGFVRQFSVGSGVTIRLACCIEKISLKDDLNHIGN